MTNGYDHGLILEKVGGGIVMADASDRKMKEVAGAALVRIKKLAAMHAEAMGDFPITARLSDAAFEALGRNFMVDAHIGAVTAVVTDWGIVQLVGGLSDGEPPKIVTRER